MKSNLPKLMLPLGLVLTVGWQVAKPAAELIWNASAAFSEMRAMKPDVEELKRDSKAHKELMSQFQITQAGMLQALKELKRPVYHTREDVKVLKDQLTGVNQGPQKAGTLNRWIFGSR